MGALRDGVFAPGEPMVREGRGRRRLALIGLLALLVFGSFLWWMIRSDEVPAPSAQLGELAAAAPEPLAESSSESGLLADSPVTGEDIAAEAPTPPVERDAVAPLHGGGMAPPPRWLSEAPESALPLARTPASEPAESLAAPAAAEPQLARVEKTAPPASAEAPALPLAGETIPRERVAEPPPPAAAPPSVPAARVRPPGVEPAVEPAPPPPAAEPARVVEHPVEPAPRPAKPPAPPPASVAKVRPPKVTVEKTVWHPTPERRVARIEVEGFKGTLELHEGDAVGTLVVAEIQPSGVVFLHGGEKLHRKVGGGQ
jgi:hypothetical protein